MKKSIPAVVALAAFMTSGAFAQTVPTKKKKKKATTKVMTKRSATSKKKLAIDPRTGKPADLTYTLFAGYENNTFKNINVSNGNATEKLKTRGIYAGLGIETSLNENISTTTTPSASITSQNRTTYDGVGTNEYSATTLKVAQSLNMNFETVGPVVQPYIEGAVGYGFISHQLSAQDTTNAYTSNLDVEGYLYEISAGVNLRFSNGLVPFAKIGVRKFTVNGNTSNANGALTSALAQEQQIDGTTDFSSASAVFGLGFQF